MLAQMFLAIKSFLVFIVGSILTFFFVILPSTTFNPEKQIPLIEQDLSLSLPDTYELESYYESWLGFDLVQEVVLKFSDEDFEVLVDQVKDDLIVEHGAWQMSGDTYVFILDPDFDQRGYAFEAKVLPSSKTLFYRYLDI